MEVKRYASGCNILRDWKCPKDYEMLRKYPQDKWAWEFLRRNPKYRREWEDLTHGLNGIRKELKAFTTDACRKWGLLSFLDPAKEYRNIKFIPWGGVETVISPTDIKSQKGTIFFIHSSETGECLFRFNTNQPIAPQLKLAKKELLSLQKKGGSNLKRGSFKPHRDEWITLIRVLDAVAAGAKPKEIQTVLCPGLVSGSLSYQWASDKKRQAKRYVEQDYRLIPFMEE
jgi:hypothetical protein